MAKTSVFILSPDFPELEGCQMLSGQYADTLSTAKRLGYDGVEIIMGDPALFDPAGFMQLLRANDLGISAINSGGIQYQMKAALVHPDPATMKAAIERLQQITRHCSELRCLLQIGVARGFAFRERPMRWYRDRLVGVLREAADYAAQLNVNVVFEYTNRFEINTINTGVEAREIVDRAERNNLGILLDTGHSYLEDPDLYQNILDLGRYVRHFHLHDSNGGAPLIGGGETDFDRVIQNCRRIGYRGWFSDGLYTTRYSEADVQRSTRGLQELYRKHGLSE